jgi:hypothetical protein
MLYTILSAVVAFHAPAVAFHSSSPPRLHTQTPQRAHLAMSSDTLGDGAAMSTDGGTFFATLDGRAEDRISPDGVLPPGEDLIEDDLRRLFNIDDDGSSMLEGSEMDDLALMFKLRKELGDADFARIFEDPRVKGPTGPW